MRPTRAPTTYRYLADLQDRPPAGWCPCCGREIYRAGENLCQDCSEDESDG